MRTRGRMKINQIELVNGDYYYQGFRLFIAATGKGKYNIKKRLRNFEGEYFTGIPLVVKNGKIYPKKHGGEVSIWLK